MTLALDTTSNCGEWVSAKISSPSHEMVNKPSDKMLGLKTFLHGIQVCCVHKWEVLKRLHWTDTWALTLSYFAFQALTFCRLFSGEIIWPCHLGLIITKLSLNVTMSQYQPLDQCRTSHIILGIANPLHSSDPELSLCVRRQKPKFVREKRGESDPGSEPLLYVASMENM